MEQHLQEDPLLKVKEVADRLKLSNSAVYNLLARGAIPFVDLASGTRIVPRIRLSHLEKFVQERTGTEPRRAS